MTGRPPDFDDLIGEDVSSAERERLRRAHDLLLAAAIAVVAFLGGYVAGFRHNSFDSTREVAMHGTSVAPSARAVIKLGKQDDAGNWPMVVTVEGLRSLPERGYYELWVKRDGNKPLRCGIFNVEAGSTSVDFSVPYTFERNDGWIVTRWRRGEHEPGRALLTT